MKLMVLKKNLKTFESNEKDYWNRIIEKLTEEVDELYQAIEAEDKAHIMEESWDVVQVITRVFKQLEKEGMDIEQGNRIHNQKLIKRGWIGKGEIRIAVKHE